MKRWDKVEELNWVKNCKYEENFKEHILWEKSVIIITLNICKFNISMRKFSKFQGNTNLPLLSTLINYLCQRAPFQVQNQLYNCTTFIFFSLTGGN